MSKSNFKSNLYSGSDSSLGPLHVNRNEDNLHKLIYYFNVKEITHYKTSFKNSHVIK